MGPAGWRRPVRIATGAVVLAFVALHYGLDTWEVLHPSPGRLWPATMRFACMCPVSGALLGLGMVLGSRPLGTLGLLLWLFFPLGATVDQFFLGDAGFEWALAYQIVLLGATPIALVLGPWDGREVPRMLGLALLLFGIKGSWNGWMGHPEAQIWLVTLLGRHFVRAFQPMNTLALVVGAVLVLATWRLPRRGPTP